MASHHSTVNRTLNNYANLRTVPALLMVLFGLSSLVVFGAFGSGGLEFAWADYELTAAHSSGISQIVFVVAFASSEPRDSEHYADWESC